MKTTKTIKLWEDDIHKIIDELNAMDIYCPREVLVVKDVALIRLERIIRSMQDTGSS